MNYNENINDKNTRRLGMDYTNTKILTISPSRCPRAKD